MGHKVASAWKRSQDFQVVGRKNGRPNGMECGDCEAFVAQRFN
jgi:hypothetical protein